MKYVYNYDPDTGEFLKATVAQLDPEESKVQDKDIFLLPANATFIEPPIARDGKIQIFNRRSQGKWSMKSDLRGTTYFEADGERVEIKKIGKRLPKNCTTKAPPLNLKRPKLTGAEWKEGAAIYEGHVITTLARVMELTRIKIANLGEEKVKTLKIIAGDGECKEWDKFLIKRAKVLKDADKFIADNNLGE